MNTLAPQTITAQPHLALDLLVPSRTNPRSRRGFDETSLNELAASIKSAGVLQPILVRPAAAPSATKPSAQWPFPNPGTPNVEAQYEIVAGERRWRAAKIAGLTDVPVIIRELSDLEVLRVQLIENVQRKDLDALEEAEGYEKLMQQQDADGNAYTAELIAKLMGISKGTVYARLKLTALCPDARNAFFDGKIDASTALLIARIPVEKLQLQALKRVTEESGWSNQFIATGDKMSFRKAREILQQEFMLDLERAPFDTQDAALLPKVGNCTDCPKRTGNAPDLFDDIGSKDVCTDPVCHGMKKAAHVLHLQNQAKDQGNEFITGKAAKKLLPNNWNPVEFQLKEHGYATLDTPVPGDAQKRTIGQVLEENKLFSQDKATGKPAVQKTVVANPYRDGQMIETVNIEAATKALREAGFEITLKGSASAAQSKQDQGKQAEKEKALLTIENTFRARLFDTLHQQIEADMLDANSQTFPALYRMLACLLMDDFDYWNTKDMVALIRKYVDLPNEQEAQDIDWESHITEFRDNLPNLAPAQHLMLIIELPLIMNEISAGHHTGEAKTMLKIAEIVGIDAAALKQEVATEVKAAAKASKKSAAKTASTPNPAAPAADKPAAQAPAKPAKSTAKKTKTKAAVAA